MKFLHRFYRLFPLIIFAGGLTIAIKIRLNYRGQNIEGSDAFAIGIGIVIMLLGVVYFLWDQYVVPKRRQARQIERNTD